MLPSPSGADLGQIWHGSGFALARADALAGARGPLQKDYMLPSPISWKITYHMTPCIPGVTDPLFCVSALDLKDP